jgi:hypothetical protein
VPPARLRLKPVAISHSLIPAHAHYRMVGNGPSRIVPVARCFPTCFLALFPPRFRPIGCLIITTSLNKAPELAHGHRVLADLVKRQIKRMLWLFIIISFTVHFLLAAHQEGSSWYFQPRRHHTGHIRTRVAQPAQGHTCFRPLLRRQITPTHQRCQLILHGRQQFAPHFILFRRLAPHHQGYLRSNPHAQPPRLVTCRGCAPGQNFLHTIQRFFAIILVENQRGRSRWDQVRDRS